MGRNNHITDETVFRYFDIAHVGSEQRAHTGTAYAGNEEHFIGNLAQHLEEFRVVDIPFAQPVHTYQDRVGTRERLAVMQVVLHVRVAGRNLLVEARIQSNLGRAVTQPEGQQYEKPENQLAVVHQQVGKTLDPAIQ